MKSTKRRKRSRITAMQLRDKLGASMQQMADILETTKSQYNMWERNERSLPNSCRYFQMLESTREESRKGNLAVQHQSEENKRILKEYSIRKQRLQANIDLVTVALGKLEKEYQFIIARLENLSKIQLDKNASEVATTVLKHLVAEHRVKANNCGLQKQANKRMKLALLKLEMDTISDFIAKNG